MRLRSATAIEPGVCPMGRGGQNDTDLRSRRPWVQPRVFIHEFSRVFAPGGKTRLSRELWRHGPLAGRSHFGGPAMIPLDLQRDQKQPTASHVAVIASETRSCARPGCGALFCALDGRGGRLYCGSVCSHDVKIQQTRSGRRIWLGTEKRPRCQDCGEELDPPGARGGRPPSYCPQCRRKRLRRYEAEKKRRKEQRAKCLPKEICR